MQSDMFDIVTREEVLAEYAAMLQAELDAEYEYAVLTAFADPYEGAPNWL